MLVSILDLFLLTPLEEFCLVHILSLQSVKIEVIPLIENFIMSNFVPILGVIVLLYDFVVLNILNSAARI